MRGVLFHNLPIVQYEISFEDLGWLCSESPRNNSLESMALRAIEGRNH